MTNEEIQVGVDTSGAVRDVKNLQSAFTDLGKTLGLSDQQMSKSGAQVERIIANMAAAHVKNAAATQKDAAASKQNVAAMDAEAAAARRLANEEKRVFAAQNLARNSGGRVINAETGRFATKDQITNAQSMMRTQEQLIALEEKGAALDRMRAINAQNAFVAEQKNLQVAREQTAEYQKRQAQLQKAFASPIVGIASPDATKWQKLANVLAQIPPATWTQKLGQATEALMAMDNSARYALYSVAAGAGIAAAAIGGFGVLAIKTAIAHERAFANVERTTQTSVAGYQVLQRQLEELSMEIPVTFEELTKIASAAGQLGISAAGVENFTRTVAQLTATTNLTSDAAGNALARFRSFFAVADDPAFAVTERTFSNLASSILKVGVNSIATESGIVNVSTQISSMGKYAGFTADQVIGLAGALSSIGVAPELARGITTRLFTIIGNAVSEGGVQLEKFASIAGLSASEFKSAWGTSAMAGVFTGFLQGLNGITENGGDANKALQDLGITAVRDRPVWLRLASAADETGAAGALLAQTLQDAREGWTQNVELGLQYSKISETAAARIQVMTQAFEQLFAALGEESGNFMGELAVQVTTAVRAFEAFAQSPVGKVFGVLVTQGALAVGAILLVVGALAGLAATIQGVGAAFLQMGATGVGVATRLTAAFRITALSLGAIGLVGALVAVIGTIASFAASAESASVPVSDMAGLIAAMREDAENGSKGMRIFGDATSQAGDDTKNSKAQAEAMTDALYGVSSGAQAGASGMDDLSGASKRAAYVFGEAARDFFKSQLALDEGFQKLFDPTTSSSQTLSKLKIKPQLFDWDAIIDESVREGGDVYKLVLQEISKQRPDLNLDDGGVLTGALQNYASSVKETFDGTRPELLKQMAAQEALAANTQSTVQQQIDDYELLEDAQKKVVDDMAAGFAKFADTGSLIGLTQKFQEIFAQVDADTETKTAQWEQAWADAYGGAAININNFLEVFRRAAGEQSTFIENLQTLGSRGVPTDIIEDLAAMGPEASKLVQALVTSTDDQLAEFESLWGQTGYDSMVRFATQAAIGQEIVNNVLRTGGIEALRAFNTALASGVGVDAALASLQRDVNGNPVDIPAAPVVDTSPLDRFNQWLRTHPLSLPVTPYSTKSAIFVQDPTNGKVISRGQIGFYAGGGQVFGKGTGTSDSVPAMLSNGEFVLTAKATRAIGAANLYNLMRSAEGRRAPRGYATGGLVGNSNSAGTTNNIMHLSVEDRKLLIDIRNAVGVTIGGGPLATVVNGENTNSSSRRVA